MEQESSEEFTYSEKEAGKESRPHQLLEKGDFWECMAVCKTVNVVTVSRDVLCCGHCLNPILDREGKKIPFGMEQLLDLPYKEGLGRVYERGKDDQAH